MKVDFDNIEPADRNLILVATTEKYEELKSQIKDAKALLPFLLIRDVRVSISEIPNDFAV